jgi:hypothetical protein
MIWKTIGFQAAAVATIVAITAFVVPLPGGPEQSPPSLGATALHGTIRAPVQHSRPASVHEDNAGPSEDTSPGSDAASSQQQQNSGGPLWSPGPEHDATENAAHHWQKHGAEFSELHSEQDYTNAAHDFVNHPPPGAEIKHDSRGDTLIYDPESNTFAVQAPGGAPRTMFRPHNGRAYWDRQH